MTQMLRNADFRGSLLLTLFPVNYCNDRVIINIIDHIFDMKELFS